MNPNLINRFQRRLPQESLLEITGNRSSTGQRRQSQALPHHAVGPDPGGYRRREAADSGDGTGEAVDGDCAADPALEDRLPFGSDEGGDLEERGGGGREGVERKRMAMGFSGVWDGEERGEGREFIGKDESVEMGSCTSWRWHG